MAKEEKEKEKEEELEDGAEQGAESKPSKKKLFILLTIMIVVSVGSAFALTTLVLPGASDPEAQEDPEQEKPAELLEGSVETEPILSNLHGIHWRRILKLQLRIDFKAPNPEEVKKAFEEDRALFKDAMDEILCTKGMEELDSKEGRKILKEEISEKFEAIFLKEKKKEGEEEGEKEETPKVEGRVERVFFLDFLIQQS